jgi:hypothetical protein
MFMTLFTPIVSGQTFLISKHHDSQTIKLCESIILPAYKTLGLDPVVISVPGRRALKMSSTGNTDAEMCRISSVSDQFPDLLKVNIVLFELKIVAVSLKTQEAIKTKADLESFTLGSLRGMKAAEDYFNRNSIKYVDNYEQVIKLLDGKLIDFAILPLPDVQYAQDKQFRNDIIIHQPSLFVHKMYHYIHNRHKSILSAIETEISQIKLQKGLP